MKLFSVFILCFFTLTSHAQLQFWNTDDVENAQWQPQYASQKVKKVITYKVDESNKRIFPDMPDIIKDYDGSAHIIASRQNKYNWVNKKAELLRADSFFYNSKGQLISYSAYEGPQMNYVSGMEMAYNSKGQQTKQDDYAVEDHVRKKTGSDILTYSPAGRAVKLVSKNTMPSLNCSRQFTYDNKGRLTRAAFISGGVINTDFTWNDKGQLMRIKETQDKKITGDVTFIYDDKGRRISRHTESAGGYKDNTTYIYRGDDMLPYISHLDYTGNSAGDIRYEHTEYVYE